MAVDVKMRPPAPADSARMLAWRNLPEIRRWMYTDHVISQEEHDRWFAGALADPSRRYWIIELDGLAVGLANLADYSPAHRRTAWAYYLADPSVRGRGLGAYVEYFVIEHVFGELGLNKLCCEVLIDNEAVWKMHEAFGFAREALFREHVWKDGKATDVVALGLLASDWSTIREASRQRLAARGFPV
ncbi:MAG: UDP-4-amino-4,6-dideoxy-N-acetyl-beta-L-altrosamine N-acetyltransferase [Phenylobacterium sp.]|uniref:UDP-4-amino-4, 6-dideoxy-N-acetyl-beta-L-altrosamine N-acetyltransferase n=1 Tax=Phenylobacterium sp. TaxID=1871053 RepID=UPI002733D67A|nr:UDP-4-amino-4,6-dideoxy-N-acetyl-beta-L-altrosamine N-acetyltransferase [Phenylobacterium sp.]MDP3747026.1 UDP-4-amino-4,6-dideoxy-N-acetyl-beta-L-altrosamine N-acetyltransferase [Phenylobacterium sp.]